jgi:hypothetical protein
MSSNIKVTVFSQKGDTLLGALVTLIPVNTKQSIITLDYRETDSRRYVAENIENGDYTLRIQAEGHSTQEKKFSLEYPQKIREFIFLGEPGTSILRLKGNLLPYFEVPDCVYVSGTNAEEFGKVKQYLSSLSSITLIPGLLESELSFVFSFKEGVEPAGKYELVSKLQQDHKNFVLGILLKKNDTDYSILSNKIRIKFTAGSVNLYVNELSRKFGLLFKLIDQEGYYVFEKTEWLNYETSDVIADIAEMEEVDEVMPEIYIRAISNANELPPVDFLYPQQWYLPVTKVPEAWQKLRTKVLNDNVTLGSAQDITYGSCEVVVGVIDNGGIKSSSTLPAVPTHPDLNVNVTSGNPKAVAFLNVPSGATNHNSIGIDNHGISCLGVAIAAANNGQGIAGVAANSKFIAVTFDSSPVSTAQINLSYRWASGLQNLSLTSPPTQGSDIITVSFQIMGAGTIYEPGIFDSSVFGRKGRGTVIFSSASNDNMELTLAQNAVAFNSRVIAVASSILDSTGLKEKKAVYSNFGQRIDICAPADTEDLETPAGSGNFPTVHNPPNDYGALTLRRDDIPSSGTTMPGVNTTSTTLDGNAGPANTNGLGNNQIKVISAAGFSVNNAVLIGEPTDFQAGIPSAATAEARRITAVSGNTITLDRNLDRLHNTGRKVYTGPSHYDPIFGGTSFSTPLVAGIAALVLSAKKTLSWIEVRDILCRTATRIDPLCQGFTTPASDVNPNNTYAASTNGTTRPAGWGKWKDKRHGTAGANDIIDASGNLVITGPSSTLNAASNAGDVTVSVSNIANFQLGQAVKIGGANPEIGVIRKIVGQVITLDNPLANAHASGVSIEGGRKPRHSAWYGFGRADAAAAVEYALNYNHDWRDLIVRDTVADTGTTAVADNILIDSPDVWVRNYAPATDGYMNRRNDKTNFPADYLPYNQTGPHQDPLKTEDRYIYVRVKNRGNGGPDPSNPLKSLETWVRAYIVLDSPGTQFTFPEHFTDLGTPNVANGIKGVKLLNEVRIAEDVMAAGEDIIVSIPWPKTVNNVSTTLETNILVQITPFDGEFYGPGGEGKKIQHNNNLTRKKVVFANKIGYREHPSNKELPSLIRIPASAIASNINSAFRIMITEPAGCTVNTIVVEATLYKHDGTSEKAFYKKTGANPWQFYNSSNNPFVPTNNWISSTSASSPDITEPVPPLVAPIQATGTEKGITLPFQLSVNFAVKKVELKTTYSAGANTFSETKIVNVRVDLPDDPQQPIKNRKVYFFTEYDLIDTQTSGQEFGPVSTNVTTQFRTTSRYSALNNANNPGGANPKAFAVTTGRVLIQQTSNPNLVNVILKPESQGAVDFINIKYFIYRGILRNTLIDSGNPDRVAPANTNAFTQSIWDTQNALNRSIENADANDTILPNSITDEPASKSLGIHYVAAPGPNQEQRLDTDYLDSVFFNDQTDFKSPVASQGVEIGKFDKNGFGFDIILDGLGFLPEFGTVRGNEYIINAPVYPASPTNQQLMQINNARGKILNYIDPCAYFGMHYHIGVYGIKSNGSDDLLKEQQLFDNLILKHKNKNRVYLDIRNENGYYFNYYNNYPVNNHIQLSFASATALSAQDFRTSQWPVRIIEKTDFGASTQTNKCIIKIGLPKGNNTKPLLYLAGAIPFSTYPKAPKDTQKFNKPEFQGANLYSDELNFGVANQHSNSDPVNPVCSIVRLYYIKRKDPAALASPATLVPTKNYFDNLFPLINAVPWSTNSKIIYSSGFFTRFIEKEGFEAMVDVGLALENTGNPAGDRVIFFAVPTDIYKKTGKAKQLFKRLLGGTSYKESFIDEVKRYFPTLSLEKKELILSTTLTKHYLRFEDGSLLAVNDDVKENFFALAMTRNEYDGLVNAANSIGLNQEYHYPTLSVAQVNVNSDTNQTGYFEYEFQVSGLNVGGEYSQSTSQITAYSGDGVFLSTDNFAINEPVNNPIDICVEFRDEDTNDQRDFIGFGRVVKRISLFTASNDTIVRKWKLRNKNGSVQTYSSGASDNFGTPITAGTDIEIWAGTRVILLGCDTIGVAEFDSIKYARIVCYFNGSYREGYISEFAFANSVDDRVLNPAGFNDDEIVTAFLNDALLDITLVQGMINEISAPNAGLTHFINEFNNNIKPFFNPSNSQSINLKYKNGTTLEKQNIAAKLKAGSSLEVNVDRYIDSLKGSRMNTASMAQRFDSIILNTGLAHDTSFFTIPFSSYWGGIYGSDGSVYINPYNDTIKNYFSVNYGNRIIQENGGNSGSSINSVLDPVIATDMEQIRTFIVNLNNTNPADPLLQTPEAQWFLNPSLNLPYFQSIKTYNFIHTTTWEDPQEPAHLTKNFRQGWITIDNSYGFLNSNNAFSVAIHELRVSSISNIEAPDDTHSYKGGNEKFVAENAWRYVKNNNFSTFESHGFTPYSNYTDLTRNDYIRHKAISQFFVRNASVGMIYLRYYIQNI